VEEETTIGLSLRWVYPVKRPGFFYYVAGCLNRGTF